MNTTALLLAPLTLFAGYGVGAWLDNHDIGIPWLWKKRSARGRDD